MQIDARIVIFYAVIEDKQKRKITSDKIRAVFINRINKLNGNIFDSRCKQSVKTKIKQKLLQ